MKYNTGSSRISFFNLKLCALNVTGGTSRPLITFALTFAETFNDLEFPSTRMKHS